MQFAMHACLMFAGRGNLWDYTDPSFHTASPQEEAFEKPRENVLKKKTKITNLELWKILVHAAHDVCWGIKMWINAH